MWVIIFYTRLLVRSKLTVIVKRHNTIINFKSSIIYYSELHYQNTKRDNADSNVRRK